MDGTMMMTCLNAVSKRRVREASEAKQAQQREEREKSREERGGEAELLLLRLHETVAIFLQACECACVRACVRECICVCVRAYAYGRACISVCARVCVRVLLQNESDKRVHCACQKGRGVRGIEPLTS